MLSILNSFKIKKEIYLTLLEFRTSVGPYYMLPSICWHSFWIYTIITPFSSETSPSIVIVTEHFTVFAIYFSLNNEPRREVLLIYCFTLEKCSFWHFFENCFFFLDYSFIFGIPSHFSAFHLFCHRCWFSNSNLTKLFHYKQCLIVFT